MLNSPNELDMPDTDLQRLQSTDEKERSLETEAEESEEMMAVRREES